MIAGGGVWHGVICKNCGYCFSILEGRDKRKCPKCGNL